MNKPVTHRLLDTTVGAGSGLRSRIVERPGLSLACDDLAVLVEDVRSIARSVLGDRDLSYGIFSGDPETLSRTVLTIVYEKNGGRPVAFNALAILDADLGGRSVEILHLGLVMVRPDVRGAGLSATLYGLTCVLLFVRRQCRAVWISSVTQVPAVVGMVAETFSDVYPSRPGARRSFHHERLAQQIMGRWRHAFGVGEEAGFDTDRFVITNAYTGGSDELRKSFDIAAKHRDAIYNDLCATALDYSRGDDLLQIGQIDMRAASRYLAKVAPPDTVPGLLGSFALLMIQAALLPLVHWLDHTQPWGSLRAWKT
jgi:GNAT superfamily N-acetyltransferase